jgi:hypothetical protein
MLYRLVIAAFFVLVGTSSAQEAGGSLTGIVTDPTSAVVEDAPIRVRHKETGAIARTRSAADGGYRLGNLPPGEYELSIETPCCVFGPFRKTGITLLAGQSLRIDVGLKEGSSLNVNRTGIVGGPIH